MIDFGIPETAEIHPKTPMKLSIEFETENAAFVDAPVTEIRKILREIGEATLYGVTEGPCQDSNGNTVGRWSWS